jgi:hypothetical protein
MNHRKLNHSYIDPTRSGGAARLPKSLHKLVLDRARRSTLLALLGLSSLVGCNAMSGVKNSWAYSGGWNNMMMSYRNEAWANKAWHRRKHHFCNEKHFHEFCEGFRAGYTGIADGGDGCSPSFPPRQYWSWKYQSAEGQEKVAAWFAGYPHGARAAEEDGIGNWTQIQTSTGIQSEYAKHGKLGPGQTVGMYPMPKATAPAEELVRAQPAGPVDAAVAGNKSLMNQDPSGLPIGTGIDAGNLDPSNTPGASIPSEFAPGNAIGTGISGRP